MLTKLTIRNFKPFHDVDIELDSPVVFVGPNNSGKTSALQALALWNLGLKRWSEKRAGTSAPKKRSGVPINRRDLLEIPNPSAKHLWRQQRLRNSDQANGSSQPRNIRIEILVEGVSDGKSWKCGLEFDYSNTESFYCRPLRLDPAKSAPGMEIPPEALAVNVAFLPPMSGLAATETRLDHGAVNVLIGEGRTAEVLRNLCYQVLRDRPDRWKRLVEQIEELFGLVLSEPGYIEERGEIAMQYREVDSTLESLSVGKSRTFATALDISSSGRGLQQTLLVLAYMYANPGSAILLDEPDAHLEILRQREIYNHITEVASENGNQIIAATHSEVLLNEAAATHQVIAFLGRPHRLDGKTSDLRKALSEIGWDQYYQAEQTGWVLYLEGPTDLSILRALAQRLGKS